LSLSITTRVVIGAFPDYLQGGSDFNSF